jgi:Cu/Ag efflux protein CusF
MSRHIVIAAALILATFATPAARAADMEGKVHSVDTSERTVTLDNGTKLWLADGVAVDAVKEGAQVKVSYEEKDGKAIVTTVEVK